MGFERSKDNLLKLKDMLVQAEDSLGFVKKAESIEEYISMAEFFDKIDSKVAAFFYKRCIVMAKETLDREWQCRAEYGYGLCHDRLGKREESINLLEDALELSKNEGLSGIPERICKKLVEIYKEVALFYENKTQEDFKFSDMALDYYEKCLKVRILALFEG
jgi:tetratricopeptide (TPR) repeat protein